MHKIHLASFLLGVSIGFIPTLGIAVGVYLSRREL